MPVELGDLSTETSLLRVRHNGSVIAAMLQDGRLFTLDRNLDALLSVSGIAMRQLLDQHRGPEIDPVEVDLLAPAESQEVWAAGVTYLRSRDARMEESADADLYAKVYRADRPELFFKANGWRVVGHRGSVGVRADSAWNVPEPELCVLSNSRGEVVAYSIGNDMSSRSIEGENALYLPQAKLYDGSCSIGPAAVTAWDLDVSSARIEMRIDRDGRSVFEGRATVADLVRDPSALVAVMHSSYTLPFGAWLMTGTSIVPPPPYTATEGDVVSITIEGLGKLINHVIEVRHSGASARPLVPPR